MSNLFETRQKVEESAEWRGSITVAVDDDQQTLSVRQLRDPEFFEVMGLIDTDELESLQNALPEEKMEEYRELQERDDLDPDEEDRLEALQEQIENADVNMFDILSSETFEGIRRAAKYAVEPDGDDKRKALMEFAEEIEERYGRTRDEDAEKYLNETFIPSMIDRATGFASFTIGIKALTETIGDAENLER